MTCGTGRPAIWPPARPAARIRRGGWSSSRPRPQPSPASRSAVSKDLLQRAADVTLKERRPLVIVPRETPYTRATLQHLLTLHDAGAVVLPASPGFYSAPQSVAQLVDFIAAKVLDAIGVEHDLITRWTGVLGAAADTAPPTAPRG